ncbi:hypothetical protein QYE76_000696 [Lolium multiflorum]|uniref:Transposase (putative) gypsy type domain-containing protein n=1 Tax=Lolium multiflorum TaxID=4521 RepID=A0AAD8RMD2_LOLMU|nr:hypothetical protein QYE76_000696 [Lolium multiflorum]
MPPRPRLTRHNTPEASMAAQDLGNLEWERSKISPQDVNLLKKLGLSKKKDALLFPSEESYPTPPMEYRVSFVDRLICGLSAPIHDFLLGLLFVYGLQLHHLTPNSILHISIFITLCECFLGVQPNWALWKRIFFIRRNGSHNIAYNIGGVVICVRPDVEYFDVKFPDSVQGWRRRWLYVREDCPDSLEYNIAPFDDSAKILRRRSWDAEASEEEKAVTEALMSRIHELQNTRGQELSDSGTSKLNSSPVEETVPEEAQPFDAYASALVSSGEEEEEPAANVTVPVSMSHTLALSETNRTAEETSDPHPELQRSTPATSPRASSPKRARIELGEQFFLAGVSPTPALDDPLMQPFINLGAQFIGYRNTVEGLKESLLAADKRAEDLANKLKASEEAREKAEKDASCIEDLRKRLHEAETALSDKITQDVAREGNVASRLESLNRWFVRKMSQDFTLENPEDDRLLDALSLLEIHADLVRRSIFDAQAAFSRLFPYFFPKKKEPDTFAALAKSFVPQEDLGLALRQENLKIGVEGTIALVAESQQNVDWAKVGEATKLKQDKWPSLIRAAKPHSKKILAFLEYKANALLQFRQTGACDSV